MINQRFVTSPLLHFDDDGQRGGPFLLDVRSRELHTRHRCVSLQSQPFEVLRLLLERAGDVVRREELRQRLWPSDTFVDYERGLNAAIRRLRVVLGDDATSPAFVETIPRVGYRFVVSRKGAAAGAVAAAFDSRSRLAVLPLLEAGGATEFADGLTDELNIQIGRSLFACVAVIARSSSMLFKAAPRRASEIGAALRVDYLLEGSVRLEAERLRIGVALVETAGETQVWNETAECDAADPLGSQEEIALRLTRSLSRVFNAGGNERIPVRTPSPSNPRPGPIVRALPREQLVSAG